MKNTGIFSIKSSIKSFNKNKNAYLLIRRLCRTIGVSSRSSDDVVTTEGEEETRWENFDLATFCFISCWCNCLFNWRPTNRWWALNLVARVNAFSVLVLLLGKLLVVKDGIAWQTGVPCVIKLTGRERFSCRWCQAAGLRMRRSEDKTFSVFEIREMHVLLLRLLSLCRIIKHLVGFNWFCRSFSVGYLVEYAWL